MLRRLVVATIGVGTAGVYVACQSFGASAQTASDADAAEPNDALIGSVPPNGKPSCVGATLRDDFERPSLLGPWSSLYTNDPTSTLRIDSSSTSSVLVASSTMDGSATSQAFLRLDLAQKEPTRRVCIAFRLDATTPATGRLIALRILGTSPPNTFGSGNYQALEIGVRDTGLFLRQLANGSCIGNLPCTTGETPILMLTQGVHDVVLDVHMDATAQDYGYADIAVDEHVERVPLHLSLATQVERELRLGTQSNTTGDLKFDDVWIDLAN